MGTPVSGGERERERGREGEGGRGRRDTVGTPVSGGEREREREGGGGREGGEEETHCGNASKWRSSVTLCSHNVRSFSLLVQS